MAIRFIGKKTQNRVIRPIPNAWVRRTVISEPISQPTEDKLEDEDKIDSEESKQRASAPRKTKKKTSDNMADERITKVQQVLDVNNLPKKQVRVEKKDKGLYERAENSVTLITEDDKMILND